jgi:hypothetical protein
VENYGSARQATDENIIWRMRFACWITKKYKHTIRICNTYCFSTATMQTRTSLHVTLYLHCLSCYFISQAVHLYTSSQVFVSCLSQTVVISL